MKHKYKIFLLLICVVSLSACCQQMTSSKYRPENKTTLDSVVKGLIVKDYYVDEQKDLGVIFTFKIDSTGEIHSAHIRRARNLKENNYYDICRKIETEVSAKFLYDQFQDKERFQKYVSCDYSFSSTN